MALRLDYEHENVVPFDEERDITRVNPIARVPVLELPDGECLVDSTAIIDYLDEIAGPDHALIPRAGPNAARYLNSSQLNSESWISSLLSCTSGTRPKENGTALDRGQRKSVMASIDR